MPSPNLGNPTRSLKREWERIVMALVVVAFLAASYFMVSGYLDGLKTNMPGPVNGREIESEFTDGAFAYLTEQGDSRLSGRHALMLPNGLRPVMALVTPTPTPTPTPVPPTQDPTPTPTPVPTPTPTPVPVPTPTPTPTPTPNSDPPKPVIRHYVIYKGYMTLPTSGDSRAVLRYERTRGDEARGSDSMLGSGDKLRGLQIESFDDDQIVLKGSDGESIIVRKGERLELDR